MTHSSYIRYSLVGSLLFFSSCSLAAIVDATLYRNFWLWAAVKPQPVLEQAEILYLHQGEITRRQGRTLFLSQGLPVNKLQPQKVWLVYRVTTLDFSANILKEVLHQRARWINKGNDVVGIQIDFDAKSYQLANYVEFLQQLHQNLPDDCKLSITGLLDWAKTGDVEQLNRLQTIIDEIVVQTYQGRHSVTHYESYLPSLLKLHIPFRIGLIQDGEWDYDWQQRLAVSPFYQGEVIFLVNQKNLLKR